MTKVAIQGIRGSYSEAAAIELVGPRAKIVECLTFADAFSAVSAGNAELAVIPVENRIVGEIETPARLLRSSNMKVLGRHMLEVRHVLAAAAGASRGGLRSVRSHVEALKQCKRFFAANPHLEQAIGDDTASSVRRIVNAGDPEHAAICSRRAAELYGAEILEEDIADDPENWTKFFLIGE